MNGVKKKNGSSPPKHEDVALIRNNRNNSNSFVDNGNHVKNKNGSSPPKSKDAALTHDVNRNNSNSFADNENSKKDEFVRLYFALEKVGKEYESRSFETDVSMGILESAIFDFLTATLNPSLREPAMYFARSFIFDVTFRTTSPLLLQEDGLDFDNAKNSGQNLFNATRTIDDDDDGTCRVLCGDDPLESTQKCRQRDRKMALALVRFLVMPIIMHSLVHSASSIISHDIFHILEDPINEE